ncbi:hypothetical protein [Spirillospora sp. NPDC047279]|uniref:hypothetical protein n=1 Tax=Spirillospora sp. NPDC047279 TaxID=3155478 RepID=UPI0033E66F64
MTLAAMAGTGLVGAMASDGWMRAQESAVELWRRVYPDRADAVAAELAEVRDEILRARRARDGAAEEAIAGEWCARLLRLLRQDPQAAQVLRGLLEDAWRPAIVPQDRSQNAELIVNQHASGQGRNYAAGGDLRINE